MKKRICCFFGHRKIAETEYLREKLYEIIEDLIVNKNAETFLFGSKSEFNSLCYSVVTKLKDKYTHICRIYVRAEYPYIDEDYKLFLLQKYEDTYFPEKAINSGKAVYIERNFEMIDRSDICVVYYNEEYTPTTGKKSPSKSGTKIAYEYAKKREKNIIVL